LSFRAVGHDPPMADDRDTILDALYAADLDAFTRERDAAAKRLRADGDKDAATEVKALRKPAVPAWAINRAVRDDRRAADALLDAGHALREAQRKLLQGGSQAAFEKARTQHAKALDRLTAVAAEALEAARGSAPEATLDRVRATLQAASTSDEGRTLLAQGRLVADVAPTGFEALGDVELPPAADTETAAQRRKRIQALERELRAGRDAAREAQEAATAARAEARTARKRADELEREAGQAAEAAERADAAVEALEEQLRAAR
jgi:hypothetical protein